MSNQNLEAALLASILDESKRTAENEEKKRRVSTVSQPRLTAAEARKLFVEQFQQQKKLKPVSGPSPYEQDMAAAAAATRVSSHARSSHAQPSVPVEAKRRVQPASRTLQAMPVDILKLIGEQQEPQNAASFARAMYGSRNVVKASFKLGSDLRPTLQRKFAEVHKSRKLAKSQEQKEMLSRLFTETAPITTQEEYQTIIWQMQPLRAQYLLTETDMMRPKDVALVNSDIRRWLEDDTYLRFLIPIFRALMHRDNIALYVPFWRPIVARATPDQLSVFLNGISKIILEPKYEVHLDEYLSPRKRAHKWLLNGYISLLCAIIQQAHEAKNLPASVKQYQTIVKTIVQVLDTHATRMRHLLSSEERTFAVLFLRECQVESRFVDELNNVL